MTEIRADMVATVAQILVTEGATVHDSDTVAILESMKMEIPVIAEGDGTVTKLCVEEGQSVQEGDLIAIID